MRSTYGTGDIIGWVENKSEKKERHFEMDGGLSIECLISLVDSNARDSQPSCEKDVPL